MTSDSDPTANPAAPRILLAEEPTEEPAAGRPDAQPATVAEDSEPAEPEAFPRPLLIEAW